MSPLVLSFEKPSSAPMPKLGATGKETGRALDPPVDSLELSPDERIGLVAVPQQEKAQVGSTIAMIDV